MTDNMTNKNAPLPPEHRIRHRDQAGKFKSPAAPPPAKKATRVLHPASKTHKPAEEGGLSLDS